MCDCLNRVLNKIEGSVKNEITEDIKDFKIEWDNASLLIENNTLIKRLVQPISYEYRRIKKSGEPHKYLTKESVNMILKFCPFCGQHLKGE